VPSRPAPACSGPAPRSARPPTPTAQADLAWNESFALFGDEGDERRLPTDVDLATPLPPPSDRLQLASPSPRPLFLFLRVSRLAPRSHGQLGPRRRSALHDGRPDQVSRLHHQAQAARLRPRQDDPRVACQLALAGPLLLGDAYPPGRLLAPGRSIRPPLPTFA
jgi:hypothetical protein